MKKIYLIMIFCLFIVPVLAKADSQPKILRVTLQASTVSLDPGGIQDSQSWVVSRQVNCQLVHSQGSTFVLDAAESIKYITPLKIILKLSNKAKFHDGTLVTAKDVLTSFNYIKESRNILSNIFSWIEKIEIIDNKTLLFSLKRQIPQFLKVLSSTNFTIFKAEFLQNAKKDKNLWRKPLGCGGYRVAESNNKYIKVIPVSQGLPIVFYLIKTNQIDASELGKYDIVTINVIGKSKEMDDFIVLEMFDPLHFFVGLNSKSDIWKTKYDRCKFLSELNTNNLLASYGAVARVTNDLIPKGTLGYNRNQDFNDWLITLSKKAVNRKVDSEAKPLCVSYLTVSIQEKYKIEYLNMFKQIYPNVYLRPITNVKKFGKDFVNGNCDVILFGWKSNYLDGYEYLTMFEDSDANFSGIKNISLSEKIVKSQSISSASERAVEYQKIIKEISEMCVIRPLFTLPTKKIYIKKDLKTPGIGLISIHQYYLGDITR